MTAVAPAIRSPRPAVASSPFALDRPVLGDRLTMALFAFCAIVPFKGSQVLWGVVLLAVLAQVLRHRAQLSGVYLTVPMLAYLAWMQMSQLWSVEPGKTAMALFMNFCFVMIGLLVCVHRSLAELLRLFVRSATALLLVCWLVTFALPSVGRMQDTSYSGAMRGLFIEKNQLGFFSVIAFTSAVVAALSVLRDRPPLKRWGPAAVALSTVLGSTSKTALSVCLVGMLLLFVLGMLGRARRPLGFSLAAWLGALAALGYLVQQNWAAILHALGRNPNLTGRTEIWHAVLIGIRERPVQGFGWKALWIDSSPTTVRLWSYNYRVPFYHAHNGYLDVTAQLGLVGLVLSLVFLLALLSGAARQYFRRPDPVHLWPLVLVLVVLVYNFTEVVAFTNTTWCLLVAFSSAISLNNRKAQTCTWPTPLA